MENLAGYVYTSLRVRIARVVGSAMLCTTCGCGGTEGERSIPVATVTNSTYTVSILNHQSYLEQQRLHPFDIESRDVRGGNLVPVGDIYFSAVLLESATPVSATLNATGTGTPGRYRANGTFGIAGNWRLSISFQGWVANPGPANALHVIVPVQ